MKLKFPLVAAAFAAVLSLTACGGGSSSSSTAVAVASPAAFSYTDNTVGTGVTAVSGNTVTVTYTGWLYSDTATDHKGTQFQSSSFSFKLGASQVIPGFEQGVLGMKVGGTRTLLIPASLAYGSTGQPASSSSIAIPPNSGVVFQVALNSVQ